METPLIIEALHVAVAKYMHAYNQTPAQAARTIKRHLRVMAEFQLGPFRDSPPEGPESPLDAAE